MLCLPLFLKETKKNPEQSHSAATLIKSQARIQVRNIFCTIHLQTYLCNRGLILRGSKIEQTWPSYPRSNCRFQSNVHNFIKWFNWDIFFLAKIFMLKIKTKNSVRACLLKRCATVHQSYKSVPDFKDGLEYRAMACLASLRRRFTWSSLNKKTTMT